MNESKYVVDREFSKVFGREIVEYDESNSAEQSKTSNKNHSSLEQLAKNTEHKQIQEELLESKARSKKILRQTAWRPLLLLALNLLALPLVLSGHVLGVFAAAALYSIICSMTIVDVIKPAKDKEKKAAWKNTADLRLKLIKHHFDNGEIIELSSPFSAKIKEKLALKKMGRQKFINMR